MSYSKQYGSLLAVIASAALAAIFPSMGQKLSAFGAKEAAVILIFSVTGLSLSFAEVRASVKDFRCHALIQGFSFILTPGIIFTAATLFPAGPLRQGLYLVAAVPTTVSSCVSFTMAASGDVSLALVNAVLGNLLGVVLSPWLLGLLQGGGAAGTAAAAGAARQLALFVVLPFTLAALAAPSLPRLREAVCRWQSPLSQSGILVIIFCSFAGSFASLMASWQALWACFACLAALHVLLVLAARLAARAAGLSAEKTVAVLFCAPQKTLALGLPLAGFYFAAQKENLALILLPLVFYHFFQLFFSGFLVSRLRRVPN